MAKPSFDFARDRAPGFPEGRYAYRNYELRRQSRLSYIFRKIRLVYIVFCSLFIAAAYPYLKYSLTAAAVLFVLAVFYGLLRYFRETEEGLKWRKAFWFDLVDYLLIACLVYLTGGLRSFFYTAYAIPILAATIRFNIKGGLCGLAQAITFTGIMGLLTGFQQGPGLPGSFYHIFSFGTMGFATWTIIELAGDERSLWKELYTFSVTDPLTGLYHSGYIRERIQQEVLRSRREGGTFSIVFIDIDRFKDVNDLYGHLIGDNVVRHVAAVMQGAVRGGDTLSRFGGDEFLLFSPGASLKEADLIMQRLIKAVQAQSYHVGAVPLRLKLSGGTAQYPVDGWSLEQLLHVADRKMYGEKSKLREAAD